MDGDIWRQVALRSVSPAVAAVIGTLLFGSVAAWITRRAQDRRAAYELRHELVRDMTTAASTLYLQTQHYWRVQRGTAGGAAAAASASTATGTPAAGADEGEVVAQARTELDAHYLEARVAGEVLERRVTAYFLSDRPRELWHRTMDLLTVRYFQLIDQATPALRRANAGAGHTGLTAAALANPGPVLAAYHEALRDAVQAVLREPLSYGRTGR